MEDLSFLERLSRHKTNKFILNLLGTPVGLSSAILRHFRARTKKVLPPRKRLPNEYASRQKRKELRRAGTKEGRKELKNGRNDFV
jgi:hypothetical protein